MQCRLCKKTERNKKKGKKEMILCGQADVRGRSEELSVWAGELDTLLLCLEDKWLADLRPSSKEGTGDGLSGTRS